MPMLSVNKIRVSPLAQKIYGDAPDMHLVESIKRRGLLKALIVTPRGKHFMLLSGRRCFSVIRKLGWTKVPVKVIEVAQKDEAEIIVEANRSREKTASQRLREAQALWPIYSRRARMRQFIGMPGAQEEEAGRVSDIIAGVVGLGSGKTLERLIEVARKRPDLLAAIDVGQRTIGGAWAVLHLPQYPAKTHVRSGPFIGIQRYKLRRAANILMQYKQMGAIANVLRRYGERTR